MFTGHAMQVLARGSVMSNSYEVRKFLDQQLEENARYERYISDQEEYEFAMYMEKRLGQLYPAWECIHGPPKAFKDIVSKTPKTKIPARRRQPSS